MMKTLLLFEPHERRPLLCKLTAVPGGRTRSLKFCEMQQRLVLVKCLIFRRFFFDPRLTLR
jgi:hypothetical protein